MQSRDAPRNYLIALCKDANKKFIEQLKLTNHGKISI